MLAAMKETPASHQMIHLVACHTALSSSRYYYSLGQLYTTTKHSGAKSDGLYYFSNFQSKL
mgnify:FL=1